MTLTCSMIKSLTFISVNWTWSFMKSSAQEKSQQRERKKSSERSHVASTIIPGQRFKQLGAAGLIPVFVVVLPSQFCPRRKVTLEGFRRNTGLTLTDRQVDVRRSSSDARRSIRRRRYLLCVYLLTNPLISSHLMQIAFHPFGLYLIYLSMLSNLHRIEYTFISICARHTEIHQGLREASAAFSDMEMNFPPPRSSNKSVILSAA